MQITPDVKYIGVNDRHTDLFEGQYIIPNGISYNSYVILDDKCAVFDTVDRGFTSEWLANLASALGDRSPDYLVVLHMEPDHSASIMHFMDRYTSAKIVTSAKALTMIKNFFGVDLAERAITVGEGSALELGRHRIVFYTAPMVHWPEVIVAYDECDKILFSADAFGKFGDLNADEDWACEARRYYFGIVGKYGQQAQALLKKAAGLDIKYICALHGPVLSENLEYYIGLYNTWSSYTPEEEGVLIAYASVYGNTRAAAELLHSALTERGVRAVITDLARCDMSEAVEDAFRYSKLVLACVTYNADVFPPMKEFLHALVERNYQNRTVGFIENGSWAPAAARVMASFFESSKNISYLDTTPKLLSALSDKSREEIMAMADEIAEK